MVIRHHDLPEHRLDYDDIDDVLLVLRSGYQFTKLDNYLLSSTRIAATLI